MITLDAALTAARQTLATVTERAERQGYYTGARTDIINSHADLRAALDMLIKAAEHTAPPSSDKADASGGGLQLRYRGIGKVRTAERVRLRLSDEEDFDRVDQVRAESDAILIGATTLRRDNPRLIVKSLRRQAERETRELPGMRDCGL